MGVMEESVAEELHTLARNALDNINYISRLLVHQARQPQVTQSSLSGPRPRADVNDPAVSERSNNSNSNQANNMAGDAGPLTGRPNPYRSSTSYLAELRQRFPMLNRRDSTNSTRDSMTGRYRPYRQSQRSARGVSSSQLQSSRAGRPVIEDMATRNVIVLGKDTDKVPSRTDKLYLERKKRIISGFDIDRRWNEGQLRKELEGSLPDYLYGLGFEFVKNCAGSLVKSNIPQNKKVDAKLLTKSIAPSGCIYLRLLNDLPDGDSEDDCLDNPAFDDSQSHITDTFPLSPRVDSDCKSNFSNIADVSGTVCASIPKNSESKSAPVVIVDEIKY